MSKSLSYILAGYNEASNISEAIELSLNALQKDFSDFEIILIDDGSKDNTSKIMEQYATANPDLIKFYPNYINLNFGASILRGLQAATKDYVIYNAADLPLNPELVKDILVEAEKHDVLVLERMDYETTTWRKITSKLNSLLLKILFPFMCKGTPVLNYIQVFRRKIIPSILPLARSPIFVWPEMIFRAKYKNLNVGNLKTHVQIKNKDGGSFGKPHDIIWGIYDMLRFRLKAYHKKKWL